MAQQITITDSQQFSLGPVSAVDAAGNPTALGGPVTFVSSDLTKLLVTPALDGVSATAKAVGPIGTAQITVSDTVLTGIVGVTIIGGAEAGLVVPLGTPGP